MDDRSRHNDYVTRERLEEVIDRVIDHLVQYINRRLSHMATQADVDALTQQVGQVASDLQSAQTQLQTEIDNIAAANPNLDLSALQSAIQPLDDSVKALGNLQPTPAPSPAPAPPAPSPG